MKKIKDVLNVVLTNNNNVILSGVDGPVETVADFMKYCDNLSVDDSIEDLNKELISVGFMPLQVLYY